MQGGCEGTCRESGKTKRMWLMLAGGLTLALFLAWYAAEKAKRRSHPVAGGYHADRVVPYTAEFEVYGNAFSHCSRKVRLVLAELGIDYLHHPIDLIETGSYQTISRGYLAVNPAGLIPTLVHRGHPVYESDDILAHLMTVAPARAPQLVPPDAGAVREMQDWLQFLALSSSDPTGGADVRAGACIAVLTLPLFNIAMQRISVWRVLEGLLFHPDKRRPLLFLVMKLSGVRMFRMKGFRALVQQHRHFMVRHLQRIDAALAGRMWLTGECMSLADVSLACLLLRLEEVGWLGQFTREGRLGNVRRYFEMWQTRSSWQAAIVAQPHPLMSAATERLRALRETDEEVRRCFFGA